VQAVASRLGGRAVHTLFLEILNPSWRNLLVHSYLRHGPDSEAWQQNLQTLERLAQALSPNAAPADPTHQEDLLRCVDAGLTTVSPAPGLHTPLLRSLRSELTGEGGENGEDGDATHSETYTRIDPDRAAELLGLKGQLPGTDPQPEVAAGAERQAWQRCLARARTLRAGNRLALADGTGRTRIVTVAFVGKESSSFVLVSRKGVRLRELSLREMADALFGGTLTLLEELELPLTERATHRMLQNMHGRLAYQATHDQLTGLINRKEFERRLERAVSTARTLDQTHALLYLDLDQFKIINNTSGHAAGDELLKTLTEHLERGLADTRHTLARLGGDEFGILLEDLSLEHGRALAERQLEMLRALRFDWKDRHFSLSASIGVVGIDPQVTDPGQLLQDADAACFAAKDAGRNRVQLFERDDTRLARRRGVMAWVAEIDRALDDDRLILNGQRIAPIGTSEPSHYEILLTILDEHGDPLPPTELIHAAETYNRMAAIDRWVIRRTFEALACREDTIATLGGLAINVSGHSLSDERFADFVLQALGDSGLAPEKVCFEITETATVSDLDNALEYIERLREAGCRFALDDFGTGLSSYAYLRRLPVDYVKIDGSFVKDLAVSPDDAAVVRSINEIAHCMGKRTIAEFVEDDAILERLREIGVDFAQGYGIDRPRPLAELLSPPPG